MVTRDRRRARVGEERETQERSWPECTPGRTTVSEVLWRRLGRGAPCPQPRIGQGLRAKGTTSAPAAEDLRRTACSSFREPQERLIGWEWQPPRRTSGPPPPDAEGNPRSRLSPGDRILRILSPYFFKPDDGVQLGFRRGGAPHPGRDRQRPRPPLGTRSTQHGRPRAVPDSGPRGSPPSRRGPRPGA